MGERLVPEHNGRSEDDDDEDKHRNDLSGEAQQPVALIPTIPGKHVARASGSASQWRIHAQSIAASFWDRQAAIDLEGVGDAHLFAQIRIRPRLTLNHHQMSVLGLSRASRRLGPVMFVEAMVSHCRSQQRSWFNTLKVRRLVSRRARVLYRARSVRGMNSLNGNNARSAVWFEGGRVWKHVRTPLACPHRSLPCPTEAPDRTPTSATRTSSRRATLSSRARKRPASM